MKKLNVRLRLSPRSEIMVGQVAEADRRIYFEFDPQFLARGLQISPFKLPLRPGLLEHVDLAFGSLPGVIDDSLPDGWGLLLLDRMFRRRGLDPSAVSPLDRLAYLGTRTMGALTYHPPTEIERNEQLLDLHKLGANAQRVYRGEAVEVLPELLRAGGSPGGARPKILVGISGDQIISGEDDLPEGFEHWIVKFCTKADVRDAGPMEFAYAAMARAARIEMPETKLFKVRKNIKYFGVKRFDRGHGNTRRHVHTFGNLIHANFRIPATDYADLMKVASALTRNYQDLLRIFRLMTFNVVTHNRDDHAKNFAFIMSNSGDWNFAPAYDLGFASGPGCEHTMTILGEGRSPSREQLMTLAKQFDIKKKEANAIIDEVNAAAGRWKYFADHAGCSNKTSREIGAKILPL